MENGDRNWNNRSNFGYRNARPGETMKIGEKTRIETTGASATVSWDILKHFGNIKNVLIFIKVLSVKTTGTTQVGLTLKQSPDGDGTFATSHSTPISPTTISSTPTILMGNTDTDTNGPLGEFLHPEVTIGGGAGEWAVVEIYIVPKMV